MDKEAIKITAKRKLDKATPALVLLSGLALYTSAVYYRGKSNGRIRVYVSDDLTLHPVADVIKS